MKDRIKIKLEENYRFKNLRMMQTSILIRFLVKLATIMLRKWKKK